MCHKWPVTETVRTVESARDVAREHPGRTSRSLRTRLIDIRVNDGDELATCGVRTAGRLPASDAFQGTPDARRGCNAIANRINAGAGVHLMLWDLRLLLLRCEELHDQLVALVEHLLPVVSGELLCHTVGHDLDVVVGSGIVAERAGELAHAGS
jgi:hypothetical protein